MTDGGLRRPWWRSVGLGILGPLVVALWAASGGQWVLTAVGVASLAFGMAQLVLERRGKTVPTNVARLGGAVMFLVPAAVGVLGAGLLFWHADGPGMWVIGGITLAMGVGWGLVGLLFIWPEKVSRTLHIQMPPGSGFYRDPDRPSGPNDILAS